MKLKKDECMLLEGKTKAEQIKICLNCPHPQCIYERGEIPVHNAQIRELRQQGKTAKELAQMINRSVSTINRMLAKDCLDKLGNS